MLVVSSQEQVIT